MEIAKLFCGVDWITCTTTDDKVGLHWSVVAHRRKREAGLSGLDCREWRNKWYSGIDYGGLSWGYSQRMGYIMIAKGDVALHYWRQLLPTASRVTRLDVQTTVLLNTPARNVALEAFQGVKGKGGRKYSIIQNSQDGQTCYVGSRHSDQFGRLYDRGVKSGEYKAGNLWRYEVQVQKPRADVLAADMIARDKQGHDIDIPTKTFVWNWFNARGIEPLYKPSDNSLIAEVGKTVTTTDKKLTWLRSQVRPTVKRLIAEGLGRDTLLALGLDGDSLTQTDFQEAIQADGTKLTTSGQ